MDTSNAGQSAEERAALGITEGLVGGGWLGGWGLCKSVTGAMRWFRMCPPLHRTPHIRCPHTPSQPACSPPSAQVRIAVGIEGAADLVADCLAAAGAAAQVAAAEADGAAGRAPSPGTS